LTKKKQTSKQKKLISNYIKIIRQFLLGKGYHPLSKKELITRLQIPKSHDEAFELALEELEQKKAVEVSKGRYQIYKSSRDIVSGVVRMHKRGFGFVQPSKESQYIQDIFIPKHQTHNAVDGDLVEVAVNLETISDKGPEGKIIAILERARSHIAGTVSHVDEEGNIIVFAPLLGKTRRVVVDENGDQPLHPGDRIVMEVTEWGTSETETYCRFSHLIGNIDDPSCDIVAAVEEFGLVDAFPVEARREARATGSRVSKKDMEGREDLRSLETVTIDPETAKDFDDALSLTKDKKGNYHLVVHIADVTHYVKKGSHLDKEAYHRCNSTYFPGKCIPMLPSELSDNLCSLKPNVIRLAVSVFMNFDHEGTLTNYRFARSVIKSDKRFSYKEAKKVLDGNKKSPYLPALELMVELCGLLKKKRYERGSIEFALPELVVNVDEKGNAVGTEYVEYDITHQLVEEFMLKTNETIATHLSQILKNITYRVHDEPEEENIKDFTLLARAFGYEISDNPDMRELQDLFEEAQSTPYGPYLASSFIRRMKLANYSADNIGHYGLALTHYCHFTSPIRRYADLIVHRILFGEDDNVEKLQEIAFRCSEQERVSAKAENSVVLLKKLRLLKQITREDPHRAFDAVITRIKPFGFFFEVLDFVLESFFHLSEMDDDFYDYNESKMQLKGRSSGVVLQPGHKISVYLKEIDIIHQATSWYLDIGQKKNGKKRKGFSRKGRRKKRS